MKIIFKPIIPQIREKIKQFGADQIERIDLDEDEFERFYAECRKYGVNVDRINYDRPRKGSYTKLDGVCIQCCYEV